MTEAKEGAMLKDTMYGRWNDSIEGYPPFMITVLWLSVQQIALEWVDANCPLAWYRPLLAGERGETS